ncbi:MAG TPA: hypothetical protein VK123_05070, partial [Candidatus Limnocylindrales bacterium]|nr:hypothetical protein [Candidatus Limnocylindrales bacterium]
MAGNVTGREVGKESIREMSKERTKALELAVQQIERQFGKGAIMKLGSDSARVQVETIPTGS